MNLSLNSLFGGTGIYFLLALSPIIILILQHLFKENDTLKKRKTFCISCGIVIFLAIALRSNLVGSNDSLNYYNNWINLSDSSYNEFVNILYGSPLEKGYLVFVWCLSHVFKNAQFLFVITGALFSISVSQFIYKYSDYPLISFEGFICLGLYTFMIQGLRQAISMSICLYAIEYVRQRNIIRFLGIVLLASIFHRTAIVFLIVYFLYGVNISLRSSILVSLIAIVVAYFSKSIILYANDFLGKEYYNVVSEGGFVALATHLLIIILAISLKFTNSDNLDDNLFFYMSLTAVFTFTERYFGAHMVQRLSYYFLYGEIILLSNSMKALNIHLRRILSVIVITLAISLLLYRLPREGLTPYLFFWQA